MSDMQAGVADRISDYWDREPEWRTAAAIAATALAIKMFVSNAVERAASDDGDPPTADDRRQLAKNLLRATDRMQYVCSMATGLLYTCVIPQQNTREAQQWAARQIGNFRRTELRIDELVYDMVTQHGPPAAAAAAKLIKLLQTAAWADPRMKSWHNYHLMEFVAKMSPSNLLGDRTLNEMSARLDSPRGSDVEFPSTRLPDVFVPKEQTP